MSVLIALMFGGCLPKVGTQPAVDSLRPAQWIQVEIGKDLCLSTFPDTPFDKRSHRKAYVAALQSLRSGDRATARTDLAVVPAVHPAARSMTAVMDLMEGEVGGSAATLGTLQEEHPDDSCLAASASLALWANGEQQRAADMLRAARAKDPLAPRMAFLSWYLEIESPKGLVAPLDVGLKSLPDHAGIQLARGSIALSVGDVELAIALLEGALGKGLDEAEGPLLQAYFVAGRRGDYLRFASRLKLPLGDEGAIAEADDPEAAYADLLGLWEGGELRATLHTSMGELSCVLHPVEAPVTVANFVGLAEGSLPWLHPDSGELVRTPLYADTPFHRVIPEFMIQGGDPAGVGTGGPGYRFLDELDVDLRFDVPGVLAMANMGPHTNGSQFFVTEAPTPHLDGLHTIFGQCDEASVELVKRIARVPAEKNVPVTPVVLQRIEIERVVP